MTDYAIAGDFWAYFPIAAHGVFAWPERTADADAIRRFQVGDRLIVKFAQRAAISPDIAEFQRTYFRSSTPNIEVVQADYDALVDNGRRAVPWALRVADRAHAIDLGGEPWIGVSVSREELPAPFTTQEFLQLRALPVEIAAQFKGITATGRHAQRLPDGAMAAIVAAAQSPDRGTALRRLTIVRADAAAQATNILVEHGLAPMDGDMAFLWSETSMAGIHDVVDGALVARGEPIGYSIDSLRILFEDAWRKRPTRNAIRPRPGILACDDLARTLASGDRVALVEGFPRFHDRFVLLAARTTAAIPIARMPEPTTPTAASEVQLPDGEDESDGEAAEDVRLAGLAAADVVVELPDGFSVPADVLAEAITALRAGKHLLLSGPPGTGKSTIAEAICRAVVGEAGYDMATATADWTTFDTIGGYLPAPSGNALLFEPGVVLRAIHGGRWLVLDEVNRADIDKAFGPLFTLLAGTTGESRGITLPYQANGNPVTVGWKAVRSDEDGYVLTPGWRLLGTLNARDKASLFQLSFAFLRRFAVVDVPLPETSAYTTWFASRLVGAPNVEPLIRAAIALATARGRELGPAILGDIAAFVREGLVPNAGGSTAYPDAPTALLAAIRLFAVPQYEGATSEEVSVALRSLDALRSVAAEPAWQALSTALQAATIE